MTVLLQQDSHSNILKKVMTTNLHASPDADEVETAYQRQLHLSLTTG
jgi:hypothetical protein